jgi:hypothetical protein
VTLTLSTRETAVVLGWLRHDGSGNADRVRALYRDGRFPPPIDPELSPRLWAWSRRVVEAYAEGEWNQR